MGKKTDHEDVLNEEIKKDNEPISIEDSDIADREYFGLDPESLRIARAEGIVKDLESLGYVILTASCFNCGHYARTFSEIDGVCALRKDEYDPTGKARNVCEDYIWGDR